MIRLVFDQPQRVTHISLVIETRAWIDSSAARGVESCKPAHAAWRSDFTPAGRRASSELTRGRKLRICDRDSASGAVLGDMF
jgi:hypothetical protein